MCSNETMLHKLLSNCYKLRTKFLHDNILCHNEKFCEKLSENVTEKTPREKWCISQYTVVYNMLQQRKNRTFFTQFLCFVQSKNFGCVTQNFQTFYKNFTQNIFSQKKIYAKHFFVYDKNFFVYDKIFFLCTIKFFFVYDKIFFCVTCCP